MSSKVQFITVDSDVAGQRLDNFLIRILKGAPKSLIYRIIRKGEVRVNKGRAKPEKKLAAGDVVRVPPVNLGETKRPVKVSDGLVSHLTESILYEDTHLMVVNKPAGLAVHGGSGIHLGLVEALRQIGGEGCYRELVHRLDRDTSGCILVAKKRSMLRYLHELLRENHKVEKTYYALTVGRWPKRRKVVDAPLKKNELQSGERVVRVSMDGKPSETHFDILRSFEEATLVTAKPITGRTHQIRVHAQYAKHPLVGDDKYGDDQVSKELKEKGIKRLFLHAFSLRFNLPDGKEFYVEAPLPDDLNMGLANLTPINDQ